MGSKGGGGGASAPKIQIPELFGGGPGGINNAFQPLGTYSSQTLPSLLGLYNWASNIATGGNVAQPDWSPASTGWLDLGTGNRTFAPFTGTGGTNPMLAGGGTGGGSGQNNLLGPLLSGAEGGIGAETNLAQQFANLTNGGADVFNQFKTQGQNIFNQGVGAFNTGTQMLNRAQNKGLFPAQQAMIDQAVASQQAAVQQQLGTEGLGSSTVAQQLKGQIKLSGAAAAGQLVQGNIQLGESEQGIGLEGEQLGTQINQTLYNEFAGIAGQNAGLQSQMWQEAMQGMGAFGTMLNATLQPFGYSLKSQEDVLQANMEEAQLQLQAQTGANQAAQAGFSSMLGGLGSLLGGGGGGGSGGLLGGLGGLLGTAGTAGSLPEMAAGATSVATPELATAGTGILGALGGAGSSIGGIISALGAIFACKIAQTVYGIDDLRWILFREYLLFRAPKPFRRAYVRNAGRVSSFLRNRPLLKGVIKRFMDVLIWYDKATRTV